MAGMIHSTRGLTRGWQLELCDPLTTRVIPSASVMRLPHKEALYQLSSVLRFYFYLRISGSGLQQQNLSTHRVAFASSCRCVLISCASDMLEADIVLGGVCLSVSLSAQSHSLKNYRPETDITW